MNRTGFLLIASLLAVSPLRAQEHVHPPTPADSVATPQRSMMEMMGMMGQMMTMMAKMHGAQSDGMKGEAAMQGMMDGDDAALVLRLRESLALSDEQVHRIQAIQQQSSRDNAERLQLAGAAQDLATAALQADRPDLSTYAARLREAADHRVQGQLALARGSVEAREVLTPAQRDKLRVAIGAMHELMKGHH